MDEAIKTIIAQGGILGAIVVCLGFYLVKKEAAFQRQQTIWDKKNDDRQTAWDSMVEARHKEVVAMAKEMTTALIEFKGQLEECKDVINHCQLISIQRGVDRDSHKLS